MAIAASAMILGLAHMNLYQFVIAFSPGLIQGWLYERSRSLVPCIALHVLYNTSLTLLRVFAGSEGASAWTAAPLPLWTLALVCALAGTLALLRLLVAPRARIAS